MEYNIQYIETKYMLISTFLVGLSDNVLDISYSINEKTLIIQIVLLKGTMLPEKLRERIKVKLSEFEIVINEIHIDKDKFNENKADWEPIYYQWLDCLLFSKAEVL